VSSKEAFDNKNYHYIRSGNPKISVASLGLLNQYLAEHAPELYGISKKSSKKEEPPKVVSLPAS